MPHFYFPSISLNTNQAMSTAPGFYTRLTNSFGYLNKAVRMQRLVLSLRQRVQAGCELH